MKKILQLRLALAFFTRFPMGSVAAHGQFSQSLLCLPLVGIIVGFWVGFCSGVLAFVLPPVLVGILACLSWVHITGGLHLDGVADCGDGLLVEVEREKRLRIMKEPQVGTFGLVAVFFVLACKCFALAELTAFLKKDFGGVGGALVLMGLCAYAALLGRSMVLWAAKEKSARADGLGKAVMDMLTARERRGALAFVFVVVLVSWLIGSLYTPFSYYLPFAFVAALCFAFVFIGFAKKRLGGVTGDVFGCLIESVECVVLLSFCLAI